MKKTCPICKGVGLEKRDAVRCPCPHTFCYKCENRSGFEVKPYEECRKCYGSGELDITLENPLKKPNVVPSILEKPNVVPSILEKPIVVPSILEKPNVVPSILEKPKGFKNN